MSNDDNPTLTMLLALDDKDLSTFYKKLKSSSSKAGSDAGKDFGDQIGASASKSIKSTLDKAKGMIAGVMAGYAVGAAFSDLVKFEKAVAEVNTLLPKNAALTKAATDEFVRMSAAYGTSATDQVKSYYSVVSAGVQGTSKQFDTLNTANKAAIAGLVDNQSAVKVLVSSMNSYAGANLTAVQASDALFVAVREGQTTFGEMSDSLGMVAPIASAAGMKFDELTGTIAYLTKSGMNTPQAVTGIKTAISSIIKPTAEAAEFAEKLGLDFSTSALRAKGFSQFMKDIAIATGGSESALAKLFPTVSAIGPVLSITTGNFDDFKRILDATATSTGATDEAFKKMEKTLDLQIKKLNANMRGISLGVMSGVAPALLTAAEYWNKVLNPTTDAQISSTTEEISKLEAEIEGLTKKQKKLESQLSSTSSATAQYGSVLSTWNFQDFDNSTVESDLHDTKVEAIDASIKVQELKQHLEELKALKQKESMDSGATGGSTPSLGGGTNQAAADQNAQYFDTESFGAMVDSITVGFTTIRGNSKEAKAQIAADAKQIANAMKTHLAGGISGGVQNIANSLMKGEDVFGNFAKFALGAMGDMSIQMGEMFIMKGLAIDAVKALTGGPAIAAGISLVALGAVMKAYSGGMGNSSTSASSSSIESNSFAYENLSGNEKKEEKQEPSTVVNLNVHGNILDSNESGMALVKMINNAIKNNGAKVYA